MTKSALSKQIPEAHSAEPVAMEKVPTQSSGPRIGLALGGGGARGFAHLHALVALDELGLKPAAIAGSSIGAIMGAGYASGMSGAALTDYCLSTLGEKSAVFSRFWKLRPKGFKDALQTGFRPGKIDLESILTGFLPDTLPQNFEDLDIPLRVTALDFFGHTETVFDKGTLIPAIAASAAIPAMFRPVTINDKIYIDGGIVNPVPFDHVMDDTEVVVAIDVVGLPQKSKSDSKKSDDKKIPATMDLLFGTSQLMMQAIITAKLKSRRPHVFLQPVVHEWRVMDFLKIHEILTETKPFKDDVKRAVDAAIALHEVETKRGIPR